MKKLIIALVGALLVSPLFASETENLVALARVWAAVKYFDPALAAGDIDWDAPLIRAIPPARAALTDEELARAVDAMLRELHDPASHVVHTGKPSLAGEVKLFRWDGETLIVNAGPYVLKNGAAAGFPASSTLRPEVEKAKSVVVDMRTGADDAAGEAAAEVLFGMQFSDAPLRAPSYNVVFHSGYAPQQGQTSGGYYSALMTVAGSTVRAAAGKVPARYAFIVDNSSRLSDPMLALREAGKAVIAAAAPVGDEIAGVTKSVPLAGSWRAEVRMAQGIETEMAADVVDADPLAAVMPFMLGDKPMPVRTAVIRPQTFPRWRPEQTYREMTYPDTEHRILAAFRLWSVIHYFYPYLQLIGDWDAALTGMLPGFIDAKNADEYAFAVLRMDAHVEDGHSSATGHLSVPKIFGDARIPIEVRLVENEFVITDPLGTAGFERGDVIVSLDGERFRDRIEGLRPLLTASTERALVDKLAWYALRGPLDKQARLEVRGAQGVRTVFVARVPLFKQGPQPVVPPYRLLEGNVGYADLRSLEVPQVDAMFEAFINTKAIIFDMRGYPRGTAWAIAPRINTRGARVGATFRRRQLSGADETEELGTGFYFEQQLPTTDKPLYRGRIITLIDDRAISQSEHSCMFFEAASGATFIGSTTAGANGDVTNFPLPGGFNVTFTGHDVRHADGRQLQRIGIAPDIAVEPTIAGLRAGRDEVLERAMKFIETGQ